MAGRFGEYIGARQRSFGNVTTRPLAIVAATMATLATSAPATAGLICGDREVADDIRALEIFARDKNKPASVACLYQALGDTGMISPKMRDNVVAAIDVSCGNVLKRDGDHPDCVVLAITAHRRELAGIQLFDLVAKWKFDVWSWDRFTPLLFALGELADSRGAPLIVAAWNTAVERALKYESRPRGDEVRRHAMMAWAGWRKEAAGALAKIGGADERAFLVTQAAATKDRYVAQACHDAITAIDVRLAKKP